MSHHRDIDPLAAFEAELLRRERRARELEDLWRMAPAERVAALLAGRLTIRQFLAWRKRHPDEIPADERIKRAQDEALWGMTLDQRVAEMNAGKLTDYQLFAWSRRRPQEVPRIDGEYAWIVYRTADWIEAIERGAGTPRELLQSCEHTGEHLLDCGCPRCGERRKRAAERMREEGLL